VTSPHVHAGLVVRDIIFRAIIFLASTSRTPLHRTKISTKIFSGLAALRFDA